MTRLYTEEFDANNLIDYDNKECFKNLFPDSEIENTIFYPEQDPNLPSINKLSLHLNDSKETIISKFKDQGYIITRYERDLISGCKYINSYYCNNLKEIKFLIKI